MTNELNNIFKQLIQQCNIEAISTKDLSATLTKLYADVDELSKKLEREQKNWENLYKEKEIFKTELNNYKIEFVEPKKKYDEAMAKLERSQWEFNIEKQYMNREVNIYKEIVKSLTSVKSESINENYSNGSYRNVSQYVDKPNI